MRFSAVTLLALAAAVTAETTETDMVKIVQQIAPKAANCADTKECRTAEQAAPFILKSLITYGLSSPAEMAGVISLMAFESVNFKYKHNVSPGRPGQGTANMQMANFNLKYAKSIDAIKDKVKIACVDGQSDAALNEMLALVQPDEYNFGSGPWFLATQCDKSVRDLLQQDADKGFAKYMECVGVQVTPERSEYFTRAKQAFGLS
jgi:hypothetical protein